MHFKTRRVLTMAVAALGLTGRAYAVQQYNDYTLIVPFSGTDDSGLNGAGNPVTDTSLLVQSYGAPSQVTQPNGNVQGQGSPDIVGTVSYTVQTNNNMFGGNSSSYSTAFYFSPTTGFHYFGQFSANSNLQYQNNGATSVYRNGVAVPAYSTMAHSVNLTGENSFGVAAAYEGIEATDSASLGVLGRHSFLFNIPTNTYTSLGLTGTAPDDANVSFSAAFNYTNTSSATSHGVYSFSTVQGVDNLGNASGTTNRYYNTPAGTFQNSAGSLALGTSEWFYNSLLNTTVQVGLYGAGYSYQKAFAVGTGTFVSETDKGSNNGFSAGSATPYIDGGNGNGSSLGTELWMYNSITNTTTPVSLYQSGITPTVAGSALSYSYSYATTYNTVSGTFRSSSLQALNSNGQVGGYSNLYLSGGSTSKGQDAFIYTPTGPTTGTYAQVGLISNGFATNGTSSFVSTAGARTSNVAYLNNLGQSAGTSVEYFSSVGGGTGNTNSTTADWFTPALGTSIQIGLTDTTHTATPSTGLVYTNSGLSGMSNSGLVAGYSVRYQPTSASTNGQDAWVYDSTTGTTYLMDPAAANLNGTNYEYSFITFISDTGIVTGEYEDPTITPLAGSSTPLTAFIWSEATGFEDLTSNINPALLTNSSIMQVLQNAFSAAPDGSTVFSFVGSESQSTGLEASNPVGVAILVAVPEPASFTVIAGLAGIACLRRRRRIGN